MTINERIQAFSTLGKIISDFLDHNIEAENKSNIEKAISLAEQNNHWFTKDQIEYALSQWAKLLTQKDLEEWVKDYHFDNKAIKIGVIQAGNLPLVGFHDFLSVLISGHIFVGKASSKDNVLPKLLSDMLTQIEPRFKDSIIWAERLKDVDAIIATGSDNSARYFEYYFGNKPNIIRKNRSSWAIITGKESVKELQLLGEDIFRYYGLGCRNISKLWVPKSYQFDNLFKALEPYAYVYNNNKYANNFDYNHSIYLMNQVPIVQNGFMILKEDIAHHSPLSVLFYEYYSDIKTAYQNIEHHQSEIQCVADQNLGSNLSVKFGQTQQPKLHEYADQINVLNWLSNL